MKVALVIDDYKEPIFARRLAEAKVVFVREPSSIPQTVTFTVVTEELVSLQAIIHATNEEARAMKNLMDAQNGTTT